jgi:hypothetical protein
MFDILIFGALAYHLYNLNKGKETILIDEYDNKPLVPIKDPYDPIELGFENQLGRRLPHTTDQNHQISDINTKVSLPIVVPLPGADRISETNLRTGINLQKHKERYIRLLSQKINENEWWRFDPWIGIVIPEKNRPRDSSVAYRYNKL